MSSLNTGFLKSIEVAAAADLVEAKDAERNAVEALAIAAIAANATRAQDEAEKALLASKDRVGLAGIRMLSQISLALVAAAINGLAERLSAAGSRPPLTSGRVAQASASLSGIFSGRSSKVLEPKDSSAAPSSTPK